MLNNIECGISVKLQPTAFKLNPDSRRHFRRQQKAKFLRAALIQSPQHIPAPTKLDCSGPCSFPFFTDCFKRECKDQIRQKRCFQSRKLNLFFIYATRSSEKLRLGYLHVAHVTFRLLRPQLGGTRRWRERTRNESRRMGGGEGNVEGEEGEKRKKDKKGKRKGEEDEKKE